MSCIHVTRETFVENVVSSPKTVLLDFYATWCGPCKMIAPILEEISEERDDLVIAKINVDEEREIATEFGIVSIPTLVVMKNGSIINQAVGYMPKEKILALIPCREKTLFIFIDHVYFFPAFGMLQRRIRYHQ